MWELYDIKNGLMRMEIYCGYVHRVGVSCRAASIAHMAYNRSLPPNKFR